MTTKNVVKTEKSLEDLLAELKVQEQKIKAEIQAKKEEAKKLKEKIKQQKLKEKAEIQKEKAEKLAKLLKENKTEIKVNKTQIIREKLLESKSIDQIVEETGFGRKEVNDRIWLIEKKMGLR